MRDWQNVTKTTQKIISHYKKSMQAAQSRQYSALSPESTGSCQVSLSLRAFASSGDPLEKQLGRMAPNTLC